MSDPSLKLGFDIRSYALTKADGKETEMVARCIEVKGKKGGGPVLLTPNEFQKAARFADDYYLYVVPVSDDGVAAKPRIFRNPTRKRDFRWMNSVQRYLLAEQDWKYGAVNE